jgi:hypothetical protein
MFALAVTRRRAMNRSLVALGILSASVFLISDNAVAQRNGPGFRGDAPSFRSGGGGMILRPPMGGSPRIGMAGRRGFDGPGPAGQTSVGAPSIFGLAASVLLSPDPAFAAMALLSVSAGLLIGATMDAAGVTHTMAATTAGAIHIMEAR